MMEMETFSETVESPEISTPTPTIKFETPVTTKKEYNGKWEVAKMPGQTLPFLATWDPQMFATYASEDQYKIYQEAELKHGRVAMLATLGVFMAEKFPMFYNGVITGPAVTHFDQVQAIFPAFWVAPTLFCLWAEIYSITNHWTSLDDMVTDNDSELYMFNGVSKLKSDHIAGDYKIDPYNLKPKKADKLMLMKNKEVNNGR